MKALFPIITALAIAAPAAAQEPPRHTQVGRLARIAFQPGSANLGDDQKLDEVATWAMQNPDGLIVLDGHADRSGEHRDNVRLSLDRAKSVKQQLVKAGVDPDQIVIAAFGDRGPRADRTVVVWATRSGMDAVFAHAGNALVETGQVAGR